MRQYSAMLRGSPSVLHRVFNKVDQGTTAFSVAKMDPVKPLDVRNYKMTCLGTQTTLLGRVDA